MKGISISLRNSLRGSRLLISLHYLFPVALGVFLGSKIYGKPIFIGKAVLVSLSVLFSFFASIVLNDFNDLLIDRITGKENPLKGDIDSSGYRISGFLFFLISLFIALCVSYRMFLIVLLGNVLHFTYSSPPFRLKRFYPVSVFLLALGALLAAIAGFAIYESARPLLAFPLKASLFIVIPLFLSLNFRDLTDFEGDMADDVSTLFTILGPARGRRAAAILIFLGYLSTSLILGYPPLLIISVPLGILSALVVLREPFREKHIFLIYFLFVAALSVLFNLKPEIIVR
ncbi:MAG: UbiA family prenyltransferase [Candidatus Hydrothermae bacterium]|nr:UbiA family prenyltransferase [Candidatus Hydrothermae bacterium]